VLERLENGKYIEEAYNSINHLYHYNCSIQWNISVLLINSFVCNKQVEAMCLKLERYIYPDMWTDNIIQILQYTTITAFI